MYKTLIFCMCLVFLAGAARASDHLLHFEAQEVFGYSSALQKTIPYSFEPDAEMQTPSVGFDYMKRFSSEFGDVATLYVQGRLALTDEQDDGYKIEPQLYPAFLKVKTPWSYVWFGHNRPSFGLSSYLDSRSLLLRTLSIQGFGYDCDWGTGAYRDVSWGDISVSVTTGSGMPLRVTGNNYMTAARVSYGVLSRDNFTAGFSLGVGRTLDTIGYTVLDSEPLRMQLAGADLTVLRDNLEHRVELLGGTWLDKNTYALLYRFGANLDQEGRLKIEAQPAYWKTGEEKDYQLALCFSILVTSTLTVRTMYIYDDLTNDNRILVQLYYYSPI
jgi:hypothetical protein